MEPNDDDELPRSPGLSYRDFVMSGLATFFVAFVWLASALFCFVVAVNMANSPHPWTRAEAPIPATLGWIAVAAGAVYFVAGIGLLKTHNWARVVGLVLGALNFAIGLLGGCLLGSALSLGGLEDIPHGPEGIITLTVYCLMVAVNLGYGIYIWKTLWRQDLQYR